MAEFLSDTWFDTVEELTRQAGELNIPKAMKSVAVNLTIRKGDDEIALPRSRAAPPRRWCR